MTEDTMEGQGFEALLRPDFRWPTEGDATFTQSKNWEQNAYIDRVGRGRLVMMLTGYKKAVDLMEAHVARDRHEGDALVSLVVFNYWQFIELPVKYLIATYATQCIVTWQSREIEHCYL